MENVKESNFMSNVIYVPHEKLTGEGHTTFLSFLGVLTQFMEERFSKFEFVLVNDDLDKEYVEEIKDYFNQKNLTGKVTFINMSRYYGLELAMNAGVDIAIGDYIFEFDKIGDGYSAELLQEVYDRCISGNDIVSVVGNSKKSNLLTKFFYWIYNHSQFYRHKKLESEMFRLVSRRAVNRVKAMTLTVPYRKVQYAQCGLPSANVEYIEKSRHKEKDYDNKSHVKINLAIDTMILFTDFIAHITIILSIFFLIFSLATGIYVCICYFGINKPVEGWAPMMGFLSAGFCGVFAILTTIIKYLSLIIRMIFVKQNYLVESVERL